MGKDWIADAATRVRRTIQQAIRNLVGDAETRSTHQQESTPAKATVSRDRTKGTA